MEWLIDTFQGIVNFFKAVFMIVKIIVMGLVELPKLIAYGFTTIADTIGYFPTTLVTLFMLYMLVCIIKHILKWGD